MRSLTTKCVITITLFLLFGMSLGATDYKLNGYVDSYVAIDNAQVKNNSGFPTDDYTTWRQFAIVNGFKNQLGVNIAQLSATVTDSSYRGVCTIQTGDMVNQAWIGFPLQEAYVGYHFFNKLWVDAGYFTTYIGGESFLPKDNYLSSHSMATYFEPFFDAGIRANYEVSDEFTVGIHIMNSYQQFFENNYNKSFGLNLAYKSKDFSASYAGAFGNEIKGAPYLAQMSMVHNFVFGTEAIENLKLKAQFDYFTLADAKVDNKGNKSGVSLMALAVQGKYNLTPDYAIALRFGYFDNADGLGQAPPVAGMDITAGIECKPSANSYIRLEGRMLNFNEGDNNEGKVFYNGTEATNSRMEVALNFGVSFDLINMTK